MQLKDATVLIVDDEVALLEIFKGWFAREGCRVLTAENGAAALELMNAHHVDVVVSDIRMPVLDGIGLAKAIKESTRYFPKIIFISGFGGVETREACDLGIEAELSKPVKRTKLLSTAQWCLTDREELWRNPSDAAAGRTVVAAFASLSAATQEGLIAFGRGGFCLRSVVAAQTGGAIGLRLEFKADGHVLAGQGVVRWVARQEEQIGIEIVSVDEADRAWVAGVAERNETISFIPRTSSARAGVPHAA